MKFVLGTSNFKPNEREVSIKNEESLVGKRALGMNLRKRFLKHKVEAKGFAKKSVLYL